MRRLLQLVVAVVLGAILFAPPAYAEEEEGHPVVVWVGTVATNVFYIPVKAVHATFGGLVGGLAYLTTGLNPEVAMSVFDHTIFTSWYVSPEMLEGKEDLYFFETPPSE